MPSTVTTQAGLIAAINAANAAGGAHTITLGANITLLENTPNNTHDGPNGLPEITNRDNLTIAGNGHTIQRSTSANDAHFRLFDVGAGATLSLKNMTLENGLVESSTATTVQGGAIFVDRGGKLNLNQVTVTNNAVIYGTQTFSVGGLFVMQGGGIYNAGTTNIVSSSVTDNAAVYNVTLPSGQGDGLGNNTTNSDQGNFDQVGPFIFVGTQSNAVVEGGGIYNSSALTVTASSISNNLANSTVNNGSLEPVGNLGNGDSNGNTDSGFTNGVGDGNGVVGNITVEGGGIYNAGTTILKGGYVNGNTASSAVNNGSYNGNNNGNYDYGPGLGDGNGSSDGNGVLGDITVAGGGIYNHLMLRASGTQMTGNHAASDVTNGSNNGEGNGVLTNADGEGNGNGVLGNILVVGGGIDNDVNGTAYLYQCTVSSNAATSSITNGSNDGQGDGDSAEVDNNDNGNGVIGTVYVAGGGIENEGNFGSGGTFTITYGSVSNNSATSSVINGSDNGNACGNNLGAGAAPFGDGDGLAGDLTVLGGGIRSGGKMTITSATLSGNSATSSVTNGNGNGNSCGNEGAQDSGVGNGDGVSGNLLVAGGAIASNASLNVTKCTLTLNWLKSTIANGSNDGTGDGQGDGGLNGNGNDCGNGVGGANGSLVQVVGSAIYSVDSGTGTIRSCLISRNSASSLVTNGTGNGVADGSNSHGTDGQGDGNGVDGSIVVNGGGIVDLSGALTIVSSTQIDNSGSSNPVTGSGNVALDGVLVNGTVTSGPSGPINV